MSEVVPRAASAERATNNTKIVATAVRVQTDRGGRHASTAVHASAGASMIYVHVSVAGPHSIIQPVPSAVRAVSNWRSYDGLAMRPTRCRARRQIAAT